MLVLTLAFNLQFFRMTFLYILNLVQMFLHAEYLHYAMPILYLDSQLPSYQSPYLFYYQKQRMETKQALLDNLYQENFTSSCLNDQMMHCL